MKAGRSLSSRRFAKSSLASATYRWLPRRSRCRTTSSAMRRDGVGWWISRASRNIKDRGLPDAGGTQILQIHEPFWLGQRRLDRSTLPHEGKHLGQTAEIDLSLPGENVSFR